MKAVEADQRHIGILHCGVSQAEVLLLHLAWHCDLRNDAPRDFLVWIDPPIHDVRARQLAAFCRKVARPNAQKIPYALSPPNDCFDTSTGDFLLRPATIGLTCATFVMAVFQAVGLQLIEASSWPARPEDEVWQRKILGLLAAKGADAEHVKRVEREVGASRFRPEEVGGAAAHEPWPAKFEDAARLAQEILERLDKSPSSS